MRGLILSVLFFGMPLAEIAAFILVGRAVGVPATLLLVLLSAVAGAALLRVQGLGALRTIRQAAEAGSDPGRPLVHGLMIVVAAILLIIPGFISDVLGLVLFIPAVRDFAWTLIRGRLTIVTRGMTPGERGYGRPAPSDPQARRAASGRVIDLTTDEFSHGDRPKPTRPGPTEPRDGERP